MQPRAPTVHECVIDGVRAVWVDTPPPLTVTLLFRVGVWDESVLTRGITHLVEHLALHPLRKAEHPFNGWVSGDLLAFAATGSEAQLAVFFAALCRRLRAIPVDRLETEADVLRAEAAGRATTYSELILAALFGANGPGLGAYAERAVGLAGPSEIQAWADRYCVQRNAVLALSGPPPAQLRIGLPVGEVQRFTLPGPDVGYRPKGLELVGEQESGIGLGTLAERTVATAFAWEAFDHRLTARLRHQLGLVYQVGSGFLPLDASTAFLSAGVDAPPGRVEETVDAFMSTLHRLRDRGPTQEEVTRLQRIDAVTANRDEVAFARDALWQVATARLLGHREFTSERISAEREAMTPASVCAAFRAATDQSAFLAPRRLDLGLSPPAWHDVKPLKGSRFTLWQKGPGGIEGLIVGREGLSAPVQRQWFTFRWKDLVLADRPQPRRWFLLHRNGTTLSVDTSLYWRGWWLARRLEKGIPRDVRLPRRRRG